MKKFALSCLVMLSLSTILATSAFAKVQVHAASNGYVTINKNGTCTVRMAGGQVVEGTTVDMPDSPSGQGCMIAAQGVGNDDQPVEQGSDDEPVLGV